MTQPPTNPQGQETFEQAMVNLKDRGVFYADDWKAVLAAHQSEIDRVRAEAEIKVDPIKVPSVTICCGNPEHGFHSREAATHRVVTWHNGHWTVCTTHINWGKQEALASLTNPKEDK